MKLIETVSQWIIAFFTTGDERNVKIKWNILWMFFLKGINLVSGFLVVPLTLSYLEPGKYGVWLTLSSIIGWFGLFDIGLSNGLRNRLGEELAKEDHKLARTYISTTMAMLTIIIGSFYFVFLIVNIFIDWGAVFNAPLIYKAEISKLVLVAFSFFIFRFIFGIISTVVTTDQRPAIADAFSTIASVLSLAAIFIISKISNNSLLLAGTIFAASNTIVLIGGYFWFFGKKYKAIAPSIGFVNFSYFKSLAGQGVQFFFIQISGVVLFSTSNFIISHVFTTADVVPYNIAFKLVSQVLLVFGIITTPFWAAYNEAYNKKDFAWIKITTKKVLGVWTAFVGVLVLLFIFSNPIYQLWIGNKVVIPSIMTLMVCVYVLVHMWNSIFVTFVFGAGKIRLITYLSVFAALFNIPLSVFLAKYTPLGTGGVVLATIICMLPTAICQPIQYLKIISGRADRIWNH